MEGATVSDDGQNVDIKPRLGCCEVCAFHDAKYTCPRCEVKTCSLRCNKIHKLEVECNGERDRTKFIPMKKFTNIDLSSDYRLLEEISRSIETSRKKFGKRMKYDIPFSLIKLRNGAAARKTVLKFLPNAFQRHKQNSTMFDTKENLIYWHIDWVFVNADNLCLSDSKVSEVQKLGTILSKYLEEQADPVLEEKFQFYQAAGYSGIKILLKAERKKGKKFYEVDIDMTLKESLRNRAIIEYPIFYVVLTDHVDQFEVIDSDCEDDDGVVEKEIKSGAEVVDSIIKHADSTDSLYTALQNLLFVSEHTDGEISD
ncbi:hypothetical protein HHI36_012646 [Cryptolaemus montrouzieri]|uniref:HIT-type domain-containing protein n=1 Tax=Cryptolaemus montrouzieri TaxID=559131 RepID=A0ABD2NEV7_9CUCU